MEAEVHSFVWECNLGKKFILLWNLWNNATFPSVYTPRCRERRWTGIQWACRSKLAARWNQTRRTVQFCWSAAQRPERTRMCWPESKNIISDCVQVQERTSTLRQRKGQASSITWYMTRSRGLRGTPARQWRKHEHDSMRPSRPKNTAIHTSAKWLSEEQFGSLFALHSPRYFIPRDLFGQAKAGQLTMHWLQKENSSQTLEM